MDCVAEFRLHDIACGDDRAVMLVPKRKEFAVKCVNYFPVTGGFRTNTPLPKVDYSRTIITLISGNISICWLEFLNQVEYLGRVYGM